MLHSRALQNLAKAIKHSSIKKETKEKKRLKKRVERKTIIKPRTLVKSSKVALREKCPNTEFFLVGIFPHSD